MNRRFIYIVIGCLMSLVMPIAVQGQITYDRVSISDAQFIREGRNVNIAFDILLYDCEVSAQRQVIIHPILEGSNGDRIALNDVIINGKRRGNIHKRMAILNKEKSTQEADQTYRVGTAPFSMEIPLNQVIAYEKWMNASTLKLVIDECGCGAVMLPRPAMMVEPEIAVLVENQNKYAIDNYILLPSDSLKAKNYAVDASILFLINSSAIDPDLLQNREELHKIQGGFQMIKSNPMAKTTSASIYAYASPDGGSKYNYSLSQKRATAFKEYVDHNLHGDFIQTNTFGRGEHWDRLVELIESDSIIERKDALLNTIQTTEQKDELKYKLKSLSKGSLYNDMLVRLFPQLRQGVYKLEYTIPSTCTIEEGRKLLQENPEALSIRDIHNIATSYQIGSKEFCEVFTKALDVYPEDAIVNFNVATEALHNDDTDYALSILEQHADDPRFWNNLGVALFDANRYEEAEMYLIKAKENGSTNAIKNLSILYNYK